MNKTSKQIISTLALALVAFGLVVSFVTFEQAVLVALIVLLVALWTNEALPMGVVSLSPIVLFPAFGILTTKEAALNYAHPIIFLFLGGFLLAIAVEKTHLHKWMAHKILSLFPQSVRGIILALIMTSGLLSAILSNTTTTLLLLPIALFLSEEKGLKLRFVLAIAYGASIGGILTPIGTPPNLILMGVMEKMGMEMIPFIRWMWMVFPLVIIMFISAGLLLSWGVKHEKVVPDLEVEKLDTAQKKVFFVLLALITLLFVNAPIRPYYEGLGLSEPGILLGAGLLLFVPPFQILEWESDKVKIPYRIMFLFGAGFAIAAAFTQTGLAEEIASHLMGLTHLPTLLFLLIIATMVTFTTEVTSNTALISIMLPILYAVAQASQIDKTLIMMMATVCASYAFMLPIATPPNAIAMSSGAVTVKHMMAFGIVLNLLGILMIVSIASMWW